MLYLAIAAPGSALPQGEPPPCTMAAESGGTATVRGVVKRHVGGCRFDGSCYLELLCKDLRIRVLYTEGEAGHQNPAVMSVADAIRARELIEAHGEYRGEAVRVFSCLDKSDILRRRRNYLCSLHSARAGVLYLT
jgi:hypothetical protein